MLSLVHANVLTECAVATFAVLMCYCICAHVLFNTSIEKCKHVVALKCIIHVTEAFKFSDIMQVPFPHS